MSREFGSYNSGYFDHQMEIAGKDCREGRDPLTKLWGEFLAEFQHVAYAIATSEACDSGPDYPIMENIQRMEELKRRLGNIESFLRPYSDCIRTAIRDTLAGANQ